MEKIERHFIARLMMYFGFILIVLQVMSLPSSEPIYLKVITDSTFLSFSFAFLAAVFFSFREYMHELKDQIERSQWAAPRPRGLAAEKKRLFDPEKSYRWFCPHCRDRVVSKVSGLIGDEHFHCPVCGWIYYP